MRNNKSNQAIQKTHRFNIIDVVVLFIILAIVGAVFVWIDPFNWINKEEPKQEKTILLVVELKEFSKKQSELIKIGDDAVFISDGVDIGKIVNISKSHSYKWDIPDEGNQMVVLINPAKDTLYITIEIECLYQEGVGYFLHNHQLFVGNSIGLKFPMLEAQGECVSITVKE